jgi:hypothetical protein
VRAAPGVSVVGCMRCNPELDPRGPRKGEHHFGVRFGFHDVLVGVSKDGALLTDVYEVEAPQRAWRFKFADPWRRLTVLCACGSGLPEAFLDESGGFSVSRQLGE